jgi:aryl-alcohol dehydrogenase-like predicted oxidoreductase
MDQIVIGGGKFKNLTQYQLNKLLDHAYALGINKIDTAPSYDCEKMIGNYLQYNPNFLISTKTLYYIKGKQHLSVNKNFQTSLENLQTNHIDCLFFHSTPPEVISEGNIDEINYLKKVGMISKIGYSGDNFRLKDIKDKSQLDCLMVTFNALDISDEHLTQQPEYEIYIKRPMANFIFKRELIKDIKFSIKDFLKMKKKIDIQSYQFRFERMQGRKKSFKDNLEFYTKFVTSFCPTAYYVFGVSQIAHLDEIINTFRILNSELTDDLISYHFRLQQKSEEFQWKSLR